MQKPTNKPTNKPFKKRFDGKKKDNFKRPTENPFRIGDVVCYSQIEDADNCPLVVESKTASNITATGPSGFRITASFHNFREPTPPEEETYD